MAESGSFCTSSLEKFDTYTLMPWIVQGNIVLVLDRKSLDEGQVIGLLCKGDVALASDVKPPWIMLEEGSLVRHPQKRDGCIKLRRQGWLVKEHPSYGILLSEQPSHKTRKIFEEGKFIKLPFVKAQAPKAASKPAEAAKQPPPKQAPAAKAPELPAAKAPAKQPAPAKAAERPSERPKPMTAADVHAKVIEEKRPAEAKASASAPASAVKVGRPQAEKAPARAEPPAKDAAEPAAPTAPVAKAEAIPPPPARAPEARRPAQPPKLQALQREKFREHIKMCSAEHWQVVPAFAFLRSEPSVKAERLAVLQQDMVFCVGHAKNLVPVSEDGMWVRTARDAKLWKDPQSDQPEIMSRSSRMHIYAYILKEHNEAGTVIRFVSKHDDCVWQDPDEPTAYVAGQPIFADRTERVPVPETQRKPLPPICGVEDKSAADTDFDASRIEHWEVRAENCMVFSDASDTSHMEMPLWRGDVIVSGPRPTRMRIDGTRWWLHTHIGTRVYRNGKKLVGSAEGFCRDAFVLLEDGKFTYVAFKKPKHMTHLMVVSGVGEPWAVEHDQVVVRQGPDIKAAPIGVLNKGDIVGVKRRQGAWVELVPNFDVRMRKSVGNAAPIWSPNTIEEIEMEGGKGKVANADESILDYVMAYNAGVREEDKEDKEDKPRQNPRVSGWMLTKSELYGQMLRRVRKRKGGLEGCIVSEQRASIYREVIELCHRRIYQENLEELWENNIDLMPTIKSIEAKLFERYITIVHAAVNNRFAGGAIVKKTWIKAGMLDGRASALCGEVSDGALVRGRCPVLYIDSCSSEPGTHAGSSIWKVVSQMPSLCVACHSVLLQSTVDFWQSKGMIRMDPISEKDCRSFSEQLRLHSVGTLVASLPDLAAKLPSSKLPLFVWINAKCVATVADSTQEHPLFTPDVVEEDDDRDI
mmetsp:Transcript_27012/g.46883  ORF Transcript_27012/g.46883 Transcript_27012/m.46883 type:complete len:921 (+) Transcript_27012:86-2848(+)